MFYTSCISFNKPLKLIQEYDCKLTFPLTSYYNMGLKKICTIVIVVFILLTILFGVVIGIYKDSFEKETTYPLLLIGCVLNVFLILSYSFLLSKFDKNKEGTCYTSLNIKCDGNRLSIKNDSDFIKYCNMIKDCLNNGKYNRDDMINYLKKLGETDDKAKKIASIECWNVSNVTNMSYAFSDIKKFNFNLSKWFPDTSDGTTTNKWNDSTPF